ncbi:MAG: thymidylate synthase [Candidatus Kaiserbacteria bacterium]|nr:thymidylate synthase [Candidatus Kaiserbacteria bacterium]
MDEFYKPFEERIPDTQYGDRLRYILEHGEIVKNTPQGVGAITCFGTLAPMVFDLSNGVPLITERKIGFWEKAVAEIIAFINGAHTIDEIASYGCDFWKEYRGKGTELGLEPNDMGPGSYGAAFHDFETPDGWALNQFEQVLEQIRFYPTMRTHLITPWIPYYTARGPNRKVIVAPCHGWLHFRIINEKLHMRMDQRSADMPVGVPSNMIEYAALLLMMCQVTGYSPGNYVHSFADAHIYENQIREVEKLATRFARRFPILRLDPTVKNLFDFRVEHFSLEEYVPHPAMIIPYSP